MKIRIKSNTVRYRLSKSEVMTLFEKGLLEERTEFSNGTLTCSICKTKDDKISADFFNNNITLYIPKNEIHKWATTEQVGLNAQMNLPNGNVLYLLMEKDFKCIDADMNDDQSDYFENPHLTC